MRPNLLFSQNIAAGSSYSKDVQNTMLEGITIHCTSELNANDRINATLKDETGSHTLLNGVKLIQLRDISDAIAGIGQNGANDIVEIGTALKIDLGIIDLRSEGHLSIEIFNGHATVERKFTVGINEVIKKAPHCPRKYVLSSKIDDLFEDIIEAYLVKKDGGNFGLSEDLNVQIECEQLTTQNNTISLLSVNLTEGSFENVTMLRAINIYDASDELPDDVEINITGSDASLCQIIYVELIENTEKVAKSTAENAVRFERKVTRLEQKRPQKMRSRRYRGKICKSKYITAAKKKLRNGKPKRTMIGR